MPRPIITVTLERSDTSAEHNWWETLTDDRAYYLFVVACNAIVAALTDEERALVEWLTEE